jgi:hypothetical protein
MEKRENLTEFTTTTFTTTQQQEETDTETMELQETMILISSVI